MTHIAPTFPLLIQSLASRGFSLSDIIRSPFRVNGIWRCEVRACS